jgi:serine-type D-Ala-D-Ala carboxypeptidase (penicillin-binding protein 5/6)
MAMTTSFGLARAVFPPHLERHVRGFSRARSGVASLGIRTEVRKLALVEDGVDGQTRLRRSFHALRVLRRFTLSTLAVAGAAIAVVIAGTAGALGAGDAQATAVSKPATTASGTVGAVGGAELGSQGIVVNYPAGHSVQRLPDINASAWLIADAGTGQVLAAKDAHGEFRPASTLKMLTAVALIPVLNPSASTVASSMAASQTPNDVGLLTGHSYQISDLFTALLTISANDAAVALAQAAGAQAAGGGSQAPGSFTRGMAIINAEAHHLQADDTVAVDPNGLDAPGQHTSAYDLALVARQALKLPAFLKYDETESALFPIKPHHSVGLWNQDSLLTDYPGAIGGKIGWTSAAGATYVGMARRGSVTLIVTLLHCPALSEITSAEKLLNWGFAEDGKVKPAGSLVAPLSLTASRTASRRSAGSLRDRRDDAARASSLTSPSALAAMGFTAIAVLAAAAGFAYSRRQHTASDQYPPPDHRSSPRPR